MEEKKEGSDELCTVYEELLPVVPLKGFVMFPGVILNFELSREKSIVAAETAIKTNQKIFVVTQKNILDDNPKSKDLYKVGVVAEIKQIIHQKKGDLVRVLAEGLNRAQVSKYIFQKNCIKANVKSCGSIGYKEDPEVVALIRKVKDMFEEYLVFAGRISEEVVMQFRDINELESLCDYVSANVPFAVVEKQKLLEELDEKKRLEHLLEVLLAELEIVKIEDKIDNKLRESLDKSQHEYILKEQMKVIAKELGEDVDPISEAMEYKNKFRKYKLPKEVFEKFAKECDRFSKLPSGSVEADLSRNYLETCLSLPWNKRTKDNIDLEKAKAVLDSYHYGLEDIKERIIEILAVRKLLKEAKSQIICLEGPPGVGKTSIAKSIAEAMGRKYQRISLGGVKDEAEIRGHRRTYIGAMAGRIISAVKQSGVKNPVILLDEIDKLSRDYQGDPSSALLEVLDPEQNNTFCDHYIDSPFDLSEVLFITTSNNRNNIPKPLYDRMEVLPLYSYTHEEKFHIAKKHLITKLLKKNGLKDTQFSIENDALHLLIESYTKEAGVRGLEKKLSSLIRKVAKKIACDKKVRVINIDTKLIKGLLGPEKYKNNKIYENSEIGVAKGLAWTEVGGETMPIEVALMKGKGKVQITGSLGDVMKESAQIAVSYIRSNAEELNVKQDFYNKVDIHIHAPEGAVPKDGPSAGVTMTTALVSALIGVPVKQDVAMTGEITLKGKVLAIGGLKEKTMAAYRDGVRTVIIPSENENDLEKIDKKVRESINFVMAKDLNTVFENSLELSYKETAKSRKIDLVKDSVLSSVRSYK